MLNRLELYRKIWPKNQSLNENSTYCARTVVEAYEIRFNRLLVFRSNFFQGMMLSSQFSSPFMLYFVGSSSWKCVVISSLSTASLESYTSSSFSHSYCSGFEIGGAKKLMLSMLIARCDIFILHESVIWPLSLRCTVLVGCLPMTFNVNRGHSKRTKLTSFYSQPPPSGQSSRASTSG